jgi:hypothetical protein
MTRPQSAQHSMHHVLNGDSVRGTLERSGIPGGISVWGDTLYDGPLPRDVDDAGFRAARARFHSGDFVSYSDALAMHERWDRGLEQALQAEEIVLWFEHDLHDQLLLVRQLDWLTEHSSRSQTLSLICIGAFPGVEPFYGLGQLDAEQLSSLLERRVPVTERQRSLGRLAWLAFTGSDPRVLAQLLAADTSALPFLDGAIRRLLEDFPDRQTGLPRTEHSVLDVLSATGALPFAELFPLHQRTEERPFMGDWTLWSRLRDLAHGTTPLIELGAVASQQELLRAMVAITDAGREVLSGTLDWMDVATLDRWIGGTHLQAPAVRWRWDATELRLVESPPG